MDSGAGGRTELLNWVNTMLGTENYKKVDQCASGVPYIMMLPAVFPNTQSIVSKAKLQPRTEYDNTTNLRLIQDALTKNGISKGLEIERMAKGNVQANLEYLQWFKRLCDERQVTPESVQSIPPPTRGLTGSGSGSHFSSASGRSAVAKSPNKSSLPASGRTETATPNGSRPGTPNTRPAAGTSASAAGGSNVPGVRKLTYSVSTSPASKSGQVGTPSSASLNSGRPGSAQGDGTPLHSNRSLAESNHSNSSAGAAGPGAAERDAAFSHLELERRFFYDKLRDIEILVSNELRVAQMSSSQLAAEVKRHLYMTYDPTNASLA